MANDAARSGISLRCAAIDADFEHRLVDAPALDARTTTGAT